MESVLLKKKKSDRCSAKTSIKTRDNVCLCLFCCYCIFKGIPDLQLTAKQLSVDGLLRAAGCLWKRRAFRYHNVLLRVQHSLRITVWVGDFCVAFFFFCAYQPKWIMLLLGNSRWFRILLQLCFSVADWNKD